MDWKAFFEKIERGQARNKGETVKSVYSEKGWLHIPTADLTRRELDLIDYFLNQSEKPTFTNKWQDFLTSNSQNLPALRPHYQFLYVAHSKPISEDLLALFQELFSCEISLITLSSKQSAFLIEPNPDLAILDLLREITPTVENDFDLSLKFFLGHTWSKLDGDWLRKIFQEEVQLFNHALEGGSKQKIYSFSPLFLKGLLGGTDYKNLKNRLTFYINLEEDTSQLVRALWESNGNQVQAAKQLYLHRNSLQHKLEKFQVTSGLNLKSLNDLSLCYWFLLD